MINVRSSLVVNTLRYYPERCINCGMCIAVCPHAVFALGKRFVELVRREACMECGACQRNCPTQALEVDSGVGCAAAMIQSALAGRQEIACGCDGGGANCCS